MIFDSFNCYTASSFTPTVCIIGAGPAGISLALQLEKAKIPSIIIEAGGYYPSTKTQDAYRGKVIGDKYFNLETARLRYLGGASNHWGGWCRHLDAIDFEPRKNFKNSGWPINKTDLDPYSKAVQSILEIDTFLPDQTVTENLKEIYFSFSPFVNFNSKYKQHLQDSPLIGLLLNSPLKEIVPIKNRISHINIYSSNGANQKVTARYFTLCTGGIENSRLLLWSNQLHRNGVVPYHETLGKYWMEHPTFTAGDTVLFHNQEMVAAPKNYGIRFYAPTPDFLRNHSIGNFGLRLHSGEKSIKTLIRDGICIAPKLFEPLVKKINSKLVCNTMLRISWEQVPVYTNRIELSSEKDAEGIPRVNLFWKKQPKDRDTIATAVRMFGSHLAKKDLGRAKMVAWLANDEDYPDDDELAGYHHMGGTRMAFTSNQGVVDANCKVFGVDNLFIGGSSVFPTGGHANPTYTIIQLALRLGDHIATLEKKLG